MIKSMTGYGRCRKVVNGRDITVEIKSVNSRYLDTAIKLNRLYTPLEENIKTLAAEYISRGKLDIFAYIDNIEGEKVNLSLNREYLEGFLKQLAALKFEYNIDGEIDINMLAGKNDIFILKKADEDMNVIWNDAESVFREAFCEFLKSRLNEGEKLKNDILMRINLLVEMKEELYKEAPEIVAAQNRRMTERITELLNGAVPDENRLLTECAVYADKSDITEELVRLSSHLEQFTALLEEDIPIGRKADFMIQEINREINTIGSKSNGTGLAKIVIEAKSELEKIREQIQNIE